MAENAKIIHASLVNLDGCGILLEGKSGSGKSDLALRLIEDKGAVLVADDAVEVFEREGRLYGRVPQNIKGLLEVRGVGIVNYPFMPESSVDLAVNLLQTRPVRLPEPCKEAIFGLEIIKIDLYALESSAPAKIIAALRAHGFCGRIERKKNG